MYYINFDDLDGSDYALISWERKEAIEAISEYLAETELEDEMDQYYAQAYA